VGRPAGQTEEVSSELNLQIITYLKLNYAIQSLKNRFAGIYSDGATPDPIPNSEVKPVSGDGSAVVTLWESSTTPAFLF